MLPFLAEYFGNPSSSHLVGRLAANAVGEARDQVAAILNADRDEVIFTSGGTESNNLAILGLAMQGFPGRTGHIITSNFEHPAVARPIDYLERLGFEVTRVPADKDGVVPVKAIAEVLREETRLVSIMHSNNEIGTLQPIAEIGELCAKLGVPLHTDASQSVGKVPIDVEELNVSLLTVAGHKVYSPKGVGALYVRKGIHIDPVLHGAGHEFGLRPGTENVPYIVALGKSCEIAWKNIGESHERLELLRDALESRLKKEIGDRLTINGVRAPRLPNTSSLNFPDVHGAELLARVPEICASTGSACHSNAHGMSATLAAIGLSPDVAAGTVRLSVGWYTSEEEIERAVSLLVQAWETR